MLADEKFVTERFETIAKGVGIGPKKLERCRKRGRVRNSFLKCMSRIQQTIFKSKPTAIRMRAS